MQPESNPESPATREARELAEALGIPFDSPLLRQPVGEDPDTADLRRHLFATSYSPIGTRLLAEVRNKKLPVTVSKTPFVPNGYYRG